MLNNYRCYRCGDDNNFALKENDVRVCLGCKSEGTTLTFVEALDVLNTMYVASVEIPFYNGVHYEEE